MAEKTQKSSASVDESARRIQRLSYEFRRIILGFRYIFLQFLVMPLR